MGVYNLDLDSFSGAELQALGSALDLARTKLEEILRELILTTAQSWGLEGYEQILVHRPPATTAAQRRTALKALLAMRGFTLAAMNSALTGCGTSAQVALASTTGTLQVSFPGLMGQPDHLSTRKSIIEEILPCHLAITYFYRYFNWGDFVTLEMTWADLADQTWGALPTYDIYA